jgi:hypothetical protein
MERLTYHDGYEPYTNPEGERVEAFCDYRTREIINRIATYEDILYAPDGTERITLDELTELLKARDEGRCGVLPCKVGDTVYTPLYEDFAIEWEIHSYHLFSKNETNVRYWATCENAEEDDMEFWLDDIGKTVFLTRSAAEAALNPAESS